MSRESKIDEKFVVVLDVRPPGEKMTPEFLKGLRQAIEGITGEPVSGLTYRQVLTSPPSIPEREE